MFHVKHKTQDVVTKNVKHFYVSQSENVKHFYDEEETTKYRFRQEILFSNYSKSFTDFIESVTKQKSFCKRM